MPTSNYGPRNITPCDGTDPRIVSIFGRRGERSTGRRIEPVTKGRTGPAESPAACLSASSSLTAKPNFKNNTIIIRPFRRHAITSASRIWSEIIISLVENGRGHAAAAVCLTDRHRCGEIMQSGAALLARCGRQQKDAGIATFRWPVAGR